MDKFHILYRTGNDLVSTSKVVEAMNIIDAIEEFYNEFGDPIQLTEERSVKIADINKFPRIVAVHTQELVDLMSSARG